MENCAASDTPWEVISPLITLITGPVAIRTGRKKIALASVLPLNFWFSITAMNRENIMITMVFGRISPSAVPSFGRKVVSIVNAFVKL